MLNFRGRLAVSEEEYDSIFQTTIKRILSVPGLMEEITDPNKLKYECQVCNQKTPMFDLTLTAIAEQEFRKRKACSVSFLTLHIPCYENIRVKGLSIPANVELVSLNHQVAEIPDFFGEDNRSEYFIVQKNKNPKIDDEENNEHLGGFNLGGCVDSIIRAHERKVRQNIDACSETRRILRLIREYT